MNRLLGLLLLSSCVEPDRPPVVSLSVHTEPGAPWTLAWIAAYTADRSCPPVQIDHASLTVGGVGPVPLTFDSSWHLSAEVPATSSTYTLDATRGPYEVHLKASPPPPFSVTMTISPTGETARLEWDPPTTPARPEVEIGVGFYPGWEFAGRSVPDTGSYDFGFARNEAARFEPGRTYGVSVLRKTKHEEHCLPWPDAVDEFDRCCGHVTATTRATATASF